MVGKGKLVSILIKLYREIFIDETRQKQFAMRFGLDICVTNEGVKIRNELASLLFQNKTVASNWSDKSLLEHLDNSIQTLGSLKKRDDYPDFTSHASNLIADLTCDFEECDAITIVEGLQVSKSLQMGNITFFPIAEKQNLLNEPPLNILFKDVSPSRDSVAVGRYRVEPRRSIELIRRDTDYCLNILRYMGSLLWPNELARQINVAGEPRQNAAYSLSIGSSRHPSAFADTDFSVMPLRLDDETMPYADFHGLSHLISILNKPKRTEIEKSLLTAIQWFGDATRELQPLAAFLKFYMPIEIILKGEKEIAKRVIPKRLCRLLDPWNTNKQGTTKIKVEIRDLIQERNSVFHSGSARKHTDEYLRLATRAYARDCLFQLSQRIISEKLKSQQGLINWINQQATKYN